MVGEPFAVALDSALAGSVVGVVAVVVALVVGWCRRG